MQHKGHKKRPVSEPFRECVKNHRFQEKGSLIPRRSILSAAERNSLLAMPDSDDDFALPPYRPGNGHAALPGLT